MITILKESQKCFNNGCCVLVYCSNLWHLVGSTSIVHNQWANVDWCHFSKTKPNNTYNGFVFHGGGGFIFPQMVRLDVNEFNLCIFYETCL